jgi:AraC-like DNA-binding protein
MNSFFEDSKSIKYSKDMKHSFYCFYDGTSNDALPIDAHWHYYIEIIYVIKGKGRIISNGYSITVSKGEMFYILPRDVHSMIGIEDEVFEYAVIKFDPALLFDSSFDAFLLKNMTPILTPVPPQYKYFNQRELSAESKKDYLEIMDLFLSKPYGYELLLKSHLLGLVFRFFSKLERQGFHLLNNPMNDVDISPILQAFEYIHDHYATQLTAKEIAQHCHISYSYFSRLFKKVSGISFSKYLNFVRITEAEKLLLSQQNSITDIGYTVGFNDTSYFIKQFKSFKQLTPKEYLITVSHHL